MCIRNARKYSVLLVVIALLIVVLAISVSGVGATVYMPPTPMPKERTSFSGTAVLAVRGPSGILIPGYDGGGGPSRVTGKWDLDTAGVASLTAGNTSGLFTINGSKKGLSAPLPKIENQLATYSKNFQLRVLMTAEDCDCIWNEAQAVPEGGWFMECRETGICFQ